MKTYIKIIACINNDCNVMEMLEKTGILFIFEMIDEADLAKELEPEQLKLFNLKLKSQPTMAKPDREETICELINKLIWEYVYLPEEFKNILLTDFIQRHICRSYKYFSELYSKHEGITIEERCCDKEIERVKQMIRDEDLTFDEISRIMRYSSPQHLSNIFKKKEKITMKEYKKRYKIIK